jgi:predicted O-methyltransferase YrrM
MNVTTDVQFPNWFSVYADRYFERHLTPYAGLPGRRFCQIGAFTGDATCWLLEHVVTDPTSLLVDVDTWEGSDEQVHHTFDWHLVEAVYDQRTQDARNDGRLAKFRGTSQSFFAATGEPFDFIYIDGDHTAFAVLNDAVAAYPLLKPGGLLAFDDYLWQSGKTDEHNPQLAIDAFRSIYRDRFDLIDIGQQVWLRRTR